MRPVTEQVEDFIEGFANGSITSVMHKHEGVPLIKDTRVMNLVAEMNSNLFNEMIPQYLTANPEKKQQMALEMLQIIMKLRMFGLIENSPISLCELQFLRNENDSLREDKKALQEKLGDLSTKLLTLSVPEDSKVGIK
jgi:hypothetical protein